jgi:hypothetical protein
VGNKFSVVYYHGWPVKNGDSHVLDLIDIVSNKKVKVICKDEQSAKELKRLTGQNPDSVVDEFGTELLEAIK